MNGIKLWFIIDTQEDPEEVAQAIADFVIDENWGKLIKWNGEGELPCEDDFND